jgi:hypothetical protein
MKHWIFENWLLNEQDPTYGGGPDPIAGVPSDSSKDPNFSGGSGGMSNPMSKGTSITNLNKSSTDSSPEEYNPSKPPDASFDPEYPDMPQEAMPINFDKWKADFFKEAAKGDVNKLVNMIGQVRDFNLDPYRRKFVEDNLQICFLRQQANIDKVSSEIRKLIKEEMDNANPANSLTNHMFNVLQKYPDISSVFIKLNGLYSLKSDLHRKFIASLLCGVQVGSGGANEDLILNQKDYSVKISTRMNARFGSIDIGKWYMTVDEPPKYLSDSEMERMESGSPEERDILKKRIVIDSIANFFKKRAFIVNVVGDDGSINLIGMDLSTYLKGAYNQGKIVVETYVNSNSEATLNEKGDIVPLADIKILFQKETGQVDEFGKPLKEQVEFITRRDGVLVLNASKDVLKEAAYAYNGINFKTIPYNGNPSDLKFLSRCVPSTPEILMRNC